MKKNGFTLIEILVSFSLASVVMILLLNVILILKDLYMEDGMKTTLFINQSNFQKRLEEEITEKEVTEVNSCGEHCLTFSFQDGSTKTLSYNKVAGTLTFDTYQVKLVKGSKINVFEATTKTITNIKNTSYNNSILSVKVSITHKLIDGEFGINLVYPYNSNVTVVSVA